MCFAKTNSIFWEIEELIRAELPLETYGSGCHVISVIAARILRRNGYEAEPQLVALYKPTMDTHVPHYIVTIQVEGETNILDFKRRVFATEIAGEFVLCRPDIKADIQENQGSKKHPNP